MQLGPEFLPATQGAQQELVLLHGWGSSREIWRHLLVSLRPWANITLLNLPGCAPGLPHAETSQLEATLQAVMDCCPGRAVFLGWSLGGQLALELAARHPERVSAVVTICSNPRFIAAGEWPGMETGVFSGFQASYTEDPVSTLRRFDSLQATGAKNPRVLLRLLQGQRQCPPGPELAAGLTWLADLDQRLRLQQLQQPQVHLLAEHDGLVPAAVRPALEELLHGKPAARVRMISGASHLAPLDSAAQLAGEVRSFLCSVDLLLPPPPEDSAPAKRDVAASFSRAAQSYDSVAKLQRDVGGQLLARLGENPRAPAVVLDLGCGTGFFRPELRARYPQSTYIGLDLAHGMIEFARDHAAGDGAWVVGDAESLPLAGESVDLVFSSLAIQWCSRPERFLAELARVLHPGGRCIFTSLGPDTLHELRASWAAVDDRQHVNTFLPTGQLAAAAGRVPGIRLAMAVQRYRMEYTRVGELLAELKTLGAHNMNRDRPAGLTSRRTLQGMLQAYEAWREGGLLPATYEVIFGEVIKI